MRLLRWSYLSQWRLLASEAADDTAQKLRAVLRLHGNMPRPGGQSPQTRFDSIDSIRIFSLKSIFGTSLSNSLNRVESEFALPLHDSCFDPSGASSVELIKTDRFD